MIDPDFWETSDQLRIAAKDRDDVRLLGILRTIPDADTLWALTPNINPDIAIARMVYRRALELGASEDTARGYLANAFEYYGDDETAAAITGQRMPDTSSTELLLAWAALDWEPQRHVERLRAALPTADDPIRVWRGIASTAINHDALSNDAAEAYRWMLQHEQKTSERARLLAVMQERGWA